MPKTILDDNGLKSSVTFHNAGSWGGVANVGVNIETLSMTAGTLGNAACMQPQNNQSAVIITEANNLAVKLENGHHLAINQCLILIQIDINDGIVYLLSLSNKTIGMTFHGHNYQFCNTENDFINFGNVNKFLTICETVNSFFVNGFPKIGTDLPFEQICFLREYQRLPSNLVTSFMLQNNMVRTDVIDLFINQNFFELDAIAHILEGSGLLNQLGGVYDPMEVICSYLKLDDVDLAGNGQDYQDDAAI